MTRNWLTPSPRTLRHRSAASPRLHGVALVLREVLVRSDQRLELPQGNVYRVESGKITKIDIFEANQYDIDEFFGRPRRQGERASLVVTSEPEDRRREQG
jgi:hypothetical protein